MKRIVISIFLILCLIFANSVLVFAGEEVNPYEKIVNEYNSIYNINLKYVQVANNTDIEQYRSFIEKTAKHEKATLDYLEKKAARNNECPMLKSAVTKTTTSTTSSYLESYKVSITYDKVNGKVSNPRNPKVVPPSNSLVSRSYSISKWSYNVYDQGVSLSITTKGTVSEFFPTTQQYNAVSNVTVVADF